MDTAINVVKPISIGNSLSVFEMSNSIFENSTIMSNTMIINTYNPKQLTLYNITATRLWYNNLLTDSGSYLISVDKLDLNSTLNSSFSGLTMIDSDISLIRFGGVLN